MLKLLHLFCVPALVSLYSFSAHPLELLHIGLHLPIDPVELWVQEWAQVEPIVVGTVALGVVRGC